MTDLHQRIPDVRVLARNGTITVRTFKALLAGQNKLLHERTYPARITAKRASTLTGWLVFDLATQQEIKRKGRQNWYRHELVAITRD